MIVGAQRKRGDLLMRKKLVAAAAAAAAGSALAVWTPWASSAGSGYEPVLDALCEVPISEYCAISGVDETLVRAATRRIAAASGVFYFRTPSAGPAKLTQVSHWNKPMNDAILSPDGRTLAFTSPVAGFDQVFIIQLILLIVNFI